MTLKEELLFFIIELKFNIKNLPGSIKRRMWNKHILLFWHRLWVRKDEFHKSLDMNGVAMLEMNKKERKKYITDLVRRREIAHQRDIVNFL